jgi:diguanylate cyclase (GGDEF)-like protein
MGASDRLTVPETYERAVRMASIAPHVAAMFEHLPQPIRLDAEVPEDPAGVPETALRLLKLAHVVDRVKLGDVVTRTAVRVVVSLGERRCVLEGDDLGQDLRAVARKVLSSLFEGSDVTRVLEHFAFQSSNLATLQRITNRMLQATDVDRALYVMLSGITSGHGLGFNRAALFVHDEPRRAFVGSKAIGPADEAEAHRIWEAIELEEKSLDGMLEDSSEQRFDTRFQQLVQSVSLKLGPHDDDEVASALVEPGCVFSASLPSNPSLKKLDPVNGFVLAAIRSHGHVRGLLFADNRYSKSPITKEQLEHIGFWIDQTALVWENLSLLARVEALARTDALTGVLNRREFEARFEAERSRCKRSGASCSLIAIDIDRFKAINDTGGHAAGDEILRKLGALLRKNLREHDIAARLGGDEFVVLLPDATTEQLTAATQRIGALARLEGISLSIGGATWPGDAADLDALLCTADAQLYAAKKAGRGCAFVRGEQISFG